MSFYPTEEAVLMLTLCVSKKRWSIGYVVRIFIHVQFYCVYCNFGKLCFLFQILLKIFFIVSVFIVYILKMIFEVSLVSIHHSFVADVVVISLIYLA